MYCASWAGNGWGFWLLIAVLAGAAAYGWWRPSGRGDPEDHIKTCTGCGGGLREEWVACPKCGERV